MIVTTLVLSVRFADVGVATCAGIRERQYRLSLILVKRSPSCRVLRGNWGVSVPTVGDSGAALPVLYRRSRFSAHRSARFTDAPRFSRSAAARQCGPPPARLRPYAPPPATARRSSAHSTTSGIRGQPPRHASRRGQPGHAPRMWSRNRLNAGLLHASAIVVGLSCTS